MLILISCAKTMVKHPLGIKTPFITKPLFQENAAHIAFLMSNYSAPELQKLLRINGKLALENYQRYQEFHGKRSDILPAILGYTGMVFKKIHPSTFTAEDFLYAQKHLRITSFCYGLLCPLDSICPYRLEGDVRLPELNDSTLFQYWRPLLTDLLIEEVKQCGGILLNLASAEMKGLFDWLRIEKEIRIITPEFQVEKGERLTTIVIYTKMLRGLLSRYVIQNQIEDPQLLKNFTAEGFEFDASLSNEKHLFYILR